MTKNKNNNLNQEILSAYMNFVLDHGKKPDSVYSFVKNQTFTEPEFYNHYGSFEGLEKKVFSQFFQNTVDLLHKNKEYKTFEAKDKLLSFYYTFFEVLKSNRSYVVAVLPRDLKCLMTNESLRDLKKHFKHYISSLDIDMIDLNQKKLEDIQAKGLNTLAWQQFLSVLHFWINDSSAAFEKTDIFIEKSLQASFDLIDIKPLRSLIDLGKFIFKDRM